MSQYSHDLEADIDLLQQLRFQTSARNQLSGKLVNIDSIGIHDHIYFDIGAAQRLKVTITEESAKLLNIAVDGQFILLIKAPNVEIDCATAVTKETNQQKNSLTGKLVSKKIEKDGGEVICQVGHQTIVSTAVSDDAQKLNEGDQVNVMIDPKNIILVKI